MGPAVCMRTVGKEVEGEGARGGKEGERAGKARGRGEGSWRRWEVMERARRSMCLDPGFRFRAYDEA